LEPFSSEWKIPLFKIYTDTDDLRFVSKVIKRGSFWAVGPEIEEFEQLLANYLGLDYCVAFNSGTSAGHAALLTIGVKPHDEIIVPSFTFISTANWIKMVTGETKFVDIEEQNLGIDPKNLEKIISKKTKLIIPVHYAGLPCKIKEISNVAEKKKIPLIEDCAESLGSKINNKLTGTIGKLSIFSFAQNKVLTTGEGGAITTNSKKFNEKLKLIRSHGRVEQQNYFSSNIKSKYISLGFNWRMSSLTAALGISQLRKLDKLINLRRKNANYYSSRLQKIDEIKVPKEPPNCVHVYQLYSILLPNEKIRNRLMLFLTKRGVMSKVFFSPIHLTDFYKKEHQFDKRKLPITEAVSKRILSLPMYPGLKKEELDYVTNTILEFFEKN